MPGSPPRRFAGWQVGGEIIAEKLSLLHRLLALGRRRRPHGLLLALRRRRRPPLELRRRCGLAPELGLLALRRRHVLVDLLRPRPGPGRGAAPGPLRRRGHLAAAVATHG